MDGVTEGNVSNYPTFLGHIHCLGYAKELEEQSELLRSSSFEAETAPASPPPLCPPSPSPTRGVKREKSLFIFFAP